MVEVLFFGEVRWGGLILFFRSFRSRFSVLRPFFLGLGNHKWAVSGSEIRTVAMQIIYRHKILAFIKPWPSLNVRNSART